MSKHEQNTYQEPSNKYLELTKEEQENVSKMAKSAFYRLVNEILTPTKGEERKSFRDGYLELFKEKQATILFLEKERDAYKKQVK